jgi:outer membrane receptor protein involved in Fe transport
LKANRKVYCAVAAILGAHAAAANAAAAAEATPAEADQSLSISEVVVTAQRREQSVQDVPITIQALTGETLSQLNVTTFDDFVKYLPNVISQGGGPGLNNIYMRGLAAAVGGVQAQGVVGLFPNVAVYLDDQSGQLPGRNLDIYAADMERIEVLEGPQGTLFGAGAQAGVVRYITNKPKLNVTEANFNAGYATTAHGANSSNIDATINLPLITDTLAVRAVIYNEKRGGYINNIPGTFSRTPNEPGAAYQYHACPANCPPINNNNIVANAINPAYYQGIRAEVLYRINDDWNVLVTQSYQNLEADGVFAEQQVSSNGVRQPDLTVQLYNPSYNKDKFENTAWTLNGRVGPLKAVYTGGYLVRNVEQVQDYTNYTRGKYANYYQCVSSGTSTSGKAQCFSPSATWHDVERNTHQSHEFRLSTPDDWRLRGLAGVFYEDYKINEQVDWLYKTATDYFGNIAPPTGYFTLNGSALLPDGHPVRYNTPGAVLVPLTPSVNNPNVRNSNDGFFDDIKRGYTQKALFTSIDFDIIPKVLTITGGTRYYRIDTNEKGAVVGSFGCKDFSGKATPLNPCVNHSNFTNLDALHLDKLYTGFKSRANITWKVTPDIMVYYTWSQGFRAGGFNRPNSVESASPLTGKWAPPVAFGPDNLTNNEIGWKTEWMDHRIQWNGAIYREDWKETQISLFDPGVTGNLTFNANGSDYRVKGIETTLAARITHELSVSAGASWNHSELVKESSFTYQFGPLKGQPIDFATLTDPKTGAVLGLANPGGALGDPLAGSPPFQANIRFRYQVTLGDYQPFAQVGAVHQAHSLSSTDRLTKDLQGNSIAYDNPGFTTYDAALGVTRDTWMAEIYGENLTDTRAELYSNYRQWYKAVTINRPRTLGLRFSYRFEGNK